MTKKLESWARADLVAEVLRLRAEVESLKTKSVIRPPEPPQALAQASVDLFRDLFDLSGTPVVDKAPPAAKPAIWADRMAAIAPKPAPEVFVQDYADGYVEFYAEAKHQTAAALLVLVGGQEVWFPKSVLHRDSSVRETGDKGSMIVPEKWASDKGIG